MDTENTSQTTPLESSVAAPPNNASTTANHTDTDSSQKKVRRRKKKSKEGPKFPHTGYVRYMNARREELRLELPNATNIERTKVIGEEWSAMPDHLKQPYLAAAEIDRERYNKECQTFKQLKSEESKSAVLEPTNNESTTATSLSKSSEKVTKQNSLPAKATKTDPAPLQELLVAPPAAEATALPFKKEPFPTANYDIPIFTEEFLEHNKIVDFELRLLRKSNTDFEQQNSVLEKHVENMAIGIEKLHEETNAMQVRNDALQAYIEELRSKLVAGFGALPLPTHTDGATLGNVDAFMHDLQQMITSNAHGPASLNKAKDILRKLDV